MRPLFLMRPISLLLTVMIICFACSKNSGHSNEPAPLIGTWKLVRTSGGIAGQTTTPPVGAAYLLKFGVDSTYTRLENGRTVDAGTFSAKRVISNPGSNDLGLALTFSNSPYIPEFYSIGHDSLTLTDYLDDGYSSLYLKGQP